MLAGDDDPAQDRHSVTRPAADMRGEPRYTCANGRYGGRLSCLMQTERGGTPMQRMKIFQSFNRRGVAGLRAVLLLGLVAGPLLWGGAGARAGTEAGLTWSPASYDFGRVKRLGGVVQTTFTLRYQGEMPLTLRRIWTS
jgi:hypothetical protein